MAEVVVKVGGSLLDWPELPGRLAAFLGTLDAREVVLVAGGGAVVDVVRAMDRAHGLGEERSHALAIRAMDLTAALLVALLPGSTLAERPEDLQAAWARGEVPILSARRLLEEIDARGPDPLPASWEVTSDSIAARVARRLGARRLVLLKSASLPGAATFREAARLGLVDPMFPRCARGLPRVELLCLRNRNGIPMCLSADCNHQ